MLLWSSAGPDQASPTAILFRISRKGSVPIPFPIFNQKSKIVFVAQTYPPIGYMEFQQLSSSLGLTYNPS